MLTHGSYQPKMAEKDKHINQGDRSLLPILSHSLLLKKRKHVEVFSIAAPRIGAYRSWEGNKWPGGSNNQLSQGRGRVAKLCVLGKWSPLLLSEFLSYLS